MTSNDGLRFIFATTAKSSRVQRRVKFSVANNFANKKNNFVLLQIKTLRKIQMQAELFWRRQKD